MVLNQRTETAQLPEALAGETVAVETRFGVYEFGPENTVYMPSGMPGFGDFHRFGLGNLPDPGLEQFKILQSLDDSQLSFILTGMPDECTAIAARDLEEACKAAGTDRETAAILLVLTVRQAGESVEMTINLRAPIVLDPATRRARQCVLSNADYSVRAPLDVLNGRPE